MREFRAKSQLELEASALSVSPCPGFRFSVASLAPGPGSTPQWRLTPRRAEWRDSESQAREVQVMAVTIQFGSIQPVMHRCTAPTLFYPVVAPQSKTSFFPIAILPSIPFLLIQAPQILHDALLIPSAANLTQHVFIN